MTLYAKSGSTYTQLSKTAATALGLGPFQTGAFHDTALAERLGLDNITSTPLYVLAAGRPDLPRAMKDLP